MIGRELIDSKQVSLSEVKAMLSGRKKEKELTYEQDLTIKYAKKFAKLTEAKSAKLIKELTGIEGIDAEMAVKIADILPQEKEILELVFQKDIKLSQESFGKILELTKKYSPDK